MKTRIRTILFSLALLGLAALSAQAQFVYEPATAILTGDTNSAVPASSALAIAGNTNFTGNQISATKQSVVTLSITFKGSGAGTGNFGVALDRSLDKVNWTSSPYTNQNFAFNGTSSVTYLWDVPVGGAGYLRLNYLTNATANYATNIVIGWAAKTGL